MNTLSIFVLLIMVGVGYVAPPFVLSYVEDSSPALLHFLSKA